MMQPEAMRSDLPIVNAKFLKRLRNKTRENQPQSPNVYILIGNGAEAIMTSPLFSHEVEYGRPSLILF